MIYLVNHDQVRVEVEALEAEAEEHFDLLYALLQVAAVHRALHGALLHHLEVELALLEESFLLQRLLHLLV